MRWGSFSMQPRCRSDPPLVHYSQGLAARASSSSIQPFPPSRLVLLPTPMRICLGVGLCNSLDWSALY